MLTAVAALVLNAATAGALFVSAYLAVFQAVDGAVILALGTGAGRGVFGVPVGTYHYAPETALVCDCRCNYSAEFGTVGPWGDPA